MKEYDFVRIHECINYQLTLAQHNVNQSLAQALAPFELTPSQYGVLECLWCCGGSCSPKQIADILGVETSTVSVSFERLQNKGLIDRLINRDDRREIIVVVTEKGAALEAPVSRAVQKLNADLMACFTGEERETLKNWLGKIADKTN